uniref:Ribosomal protein L27a n=1 Tax=Solanum tuberosum TaxID=4113 RepID=M1BBE9_SOLTU
MSQHTFKLGRSKTTPSRQDQFWEFYLPEFDSVKPYRLLNVLAIHSRQPVVVKAKLVSKNAEKKIKENGGAVVITA